MKNSKYTKLIISAIIVVTILSVLTIVLINMMPYIKYTINKNTIYENVCYKSDDPDIWYDFNEKRGEININGEIKAITIIPDTNAPYWSMYYTEDAIGIINGDKVLINGECVYSENEIKLKISYNCLNGVETNTIVFHKEKK